MEPTIPSRSAGEKNSSLQTPLLLSMLAHRYVDIDAPLLHPGFKSRQWRQGAEQGRMLVYRSVRGEEGTVAGTVERAVRGMPLDNTTHVRAGCGEGDDVA